MPPPPTNVVLYDGNCRICTAQINKLPWWDCQQRLTYLSLHDPEVATRWPDLSHDRLLEEMCIIDPHGHPHWGPYAIRYLTRRLRRLWWAAPLLHFPGSMILWRPLYRWIARNRYRLSGFQNGGFQNGGSQNGGSQNGDPQNCDTDACNLHR